MGQELLVVEIVDQRSLLRIASNFVPPPSQYPGP
jgi:hypothetical protein